MFYYSWVVGNSGVQWTTQYAFAFPNVKGLRLRYGYVTTPMWEDGSEQGEGKVIVSLSVGLTTIPLVANPVITYGPTNGGSLANSAYTISFDHYKTLDVNFPIPLQSSFDVGVFVINTGANPVPGPITSFCTVLLGFEGKDASGNNLDVIPPDDVIRRIIDNGKPIKFPKQ